MAEKKLATVTSLPIAPARQSLPAMPNRLAELKQSEQWKQMTRQEQRGHEAFEHRATAVLSAIQSADEKFDVERQEEIAAVLDSARAWDAFLQDVSGEITAEEREAFITTKSNDLAALLTTHQAARDALTRLTDERLHDILIRPEHEWVKPTAGDVLEDLLTFGEAELARRGLPPLSFSESLLNVFSFGMVAEKKVRDAERARLTPSAPTDVLEEGVIDADFTTH
jgi:hypothetical protein